MKKHVLMAVLGAMTLAACNNNPNIPAQQALGVLEVSINTDGLSTARLESKLSGQVATYREANVVFGIGTTNVVSSTNSAFDYLVATFPVSHTGSSASAFQNLTLYALAKNGNVGDTAIRSITNFGGVTNTTEQARIAKLLVPVHAVTTSGGNVVIDNSKADFQAFTSAEVSAATSAAGSNITVNDTILNYGFSARCVTNCTANFRSIPTNGTGNISIAIRVPKAALSTTYGFVMNFVVMDESVSRVTRGVFPSESIANAETRGTSVSATRLMQVGLNQEVMSGTLADDFVNDVNTSKLGASIQALGMGRISTGSFHSCGLTSNGTAYCWGNNTNGQLGDNSNTSSSIPVAVAAPSGGSTLTFSSISAGGFHSCGLTSNGTAYCWGENGFGELGNNSSTDSSIPVAVAAPSGGSTLTFSSISAGGSHACGLTPSGAAYCWGFNTFGGLGNNSTANSRIPVAVAAPSGGSTLTFSSINAGGVHSCGVTLSGTAYCWGRNIGGQLGNNTTTNSTIPVAVAAPSGGSTLTFSSIGAGGFHSCGLTLTGAAYCWGENGNGGQLGNNSTTDSNIPVAVAAPSGGSTLTFSSISVGSFHACGVTLSGTAYCWGFNGYGRLGNNSTTDSSIPVAVAAPSGGSTLTFSSISAGDPQSCGLTSSGIVYCWGRNNNGQLGNNSTTDSSIPVAVFNTLFKI